jgi:hypothetical protein
MRLCFDETLRARQNAQPPMSYTMPPVPRANLDCLEDLHNVHNSTDGGQLPHLLGCRHLIYGNSMPVPDDQCP